MPPFNNHTEKNRNQDTAFTDMKALLQNEINHIVDGGANKGQSAMEFSRHFPFAKIYSFEPHQDVFTILTNKFDGNPAIKCFNQALGELNGEKDFFINRKLTLNSTLQKGDEAELYAAKPKDIQNIDIKRIPIITIDSFMQEKKLEKIDILKLDLQGGELNCLKGSTDSLNSGTISLIFTEISFVRLYQEAPLFYQICDFLERYNYSLFDVYDLINAGNGQLKRGDALFISPEIRKNINISLNQTIRQHFK